MTDSELLIRMLNAGRMIDEYIEADLLRLKQIAELEDWYQERNPIYVLRDLAEHELKNNVEAAALSEFTDKEYEQFQQYW